jgi:hypothetical protein
MPLSSVTRDALGGWYFPSGSTEWATLLAGSGLGLPVSVWSLQERSGGVFGDSVQGNGNNDLVVGTSTAEYVPGWSRIGIIPSFSNTTNPNLNIAVSSSLLLTVVRPRALQTASTGTVVGLGVNTSYRAIAFTGEVGVQPGHTGSWMYATIDGSAQPTGSLPVTSGQVYLVALRVNLTAGSTGLVTEYETITQTPYTVPPNTGAGILWGAALTNTANVDFLYGALWQGPTAEMTDTQVQSLFNLMKYGTVARGVTQDTTSGWRAPRDPTEWALLLTGSGVPVPSAAYNMTETSSPTADNVGQDMFYSDHLTAGTVGVGGTFPGWSRPGFQTYDGGAYGVQTANTLTGASRAVLMYYGISGSAELLNMLNYMGNGLDVSLVSGSIYAVGGNRVGTGVRGSVPAALPSVRPFLYVVNDTAGTNKYYSTVESVVGSAGIVDANTITLGSNVSSQPAPSGTLLYAAVWTGSYAEMTDTQAATLLRLAQFGTLSSGSAVARNLLMLMGYGS